MNEGAEEDGNVEGVFAGSMRGRLEFWSRSPYIYTVVGMTNCKSFLFSWHGIAVLCRNISVCFDSRDGGHGCIIERH